MVLWYVAEGHEPNPSEARERLEYLNEHGETPYAFTFRSNFTQSEASNYKKTIE